ncbi:hypothetical protein D3C73_1029260 [compost metagenome]
MREVDAVRQVVADPAVLNNQPAGVDGRSMSVIPDPHAAFKMLYPDIMNDRVIAEIIHKSFVDRILVMT